MENREAPLPKGVGSAAAGYSSPPSHPPNPNPSAIEASIWRQGEQAAVEIIRHIQPTVVSEQRRKVVVEYLQMLINGFVGSEAFPFGSFPLKTYLPGGDIDLTTICIPSSEDDAASDVRTILEKEEHNKDSEFEVKDIQFINAEVKLVKCVVQNIMIDISFNQIGGLCTLCFLEQVDRFIGRDHLFKRSIILIKAWCYYESRILGSYHGLISTYALETLILYIFHLFHSSFDGPLAVLYRFLDYYSKFDWDKYCISLQGPVSLSSLPELSVEAFDNDGGDLLLTEEFLRSCVDTFSVPVRGSEGNSRHFTKKHLNIVDPLRENNNLGRSVSKGNFYRIRSALTYGARKLGRLLLLPAGSIGDEVNLFFMNTMARHGSGERPDVHDLVPRWPYVAFAESSGVDLVQPVEKLEKEKADELSSETPSKAYRDLNKEMKNIRISGLDEREGIVALQKTPSHKQQNSTSGEVSSERHTGDAKDLAASRASVLRSMTDSPKTSSSTKEDGILDFRNAYHAPDLFFTPESRTKKDLKLDQINSTSLGSSCNIPSTRALSSDEEINISMQPDSCETDSSLSKTGWAGNFGDGYPSERLHLVDYGLEGNIGNRISGPSLLNEMPDLSGDIDIHLQNLNYALLCQEQLLNSYLCPSHQSPPYSYYRHGKDVWTHGSMLTSPVSPRPPFSPAAFYSVNIPFISSSYNTEDVPRPRGTGTYIPNMNYQRYRERHSPGRAKNAVSANHPPRPQNNSQADTSQDMSSVDIGSHEPAIQAQPAFSEDGRGKLPAQLDIPESSSQHAFQAPPNANEIVDPPEFGTLEFGSLGPVSVESPTKEHGRKSDSSISHSQGSGFTSPASSSLRPAKNSSRGRTSQPYQMKDEDFPPLSG